MHSQKSQRLFLDMLKGIAVFLMLWGHCIQCSMGGTEPDFFENPVFRLIYSFHMPLFMLISGYLFYYSFGKRDMKELILHRSKPLLSTIVFCGILIYYATDGVIGLLQGDFGALLLGKWLESLSGLWFLWAVLTASLIVAVIGKTVKQVWLQVLVLLLCTPLLLLFPNGIMAVYMYPYFLIGFYYAQYGSRIPRIVSYMRYLSLPLFPLLMLFFEKKHYIYTTGIFGSAYSIGEYAEINLFRWTIGGVGSIFAITLAELCFRLFTEKRSKPLLSMGLAKMGGCSLQIYALSTIFVSFYLPLLAEKVAELLGGNAFAQPVWLYSFGIALPISIAASFGLYGLVKLCDKIGLGKILFGR